MKKLFYLIAALMLCVLSSCEKDPILTLSVDTVTAPTKGCSTTVIVNSNYPWSVTGTDWCTVSPSSGEGGSVQVTVSVKENTSYDARQYTLIFSSKDISSSIEVNQDASYGVVVPKNNYELSSEAQQISVEVKANVEYDVVISADWIKQNGTKALTSKTYVFDVEKNDTYDAREGAITIKEKNGHLTEVMKVKQVQQDAIIISSKEYNVSSEAQSLEIKLQTNTDLEIIIPDTAQEWISHTSTKALVDKIIVLDVKANEEYDSRTCSIVVKQKNSTLADTVKISQAQKNALVISQKEYKLTAAAHALEVKLQTNVNFEVIIPDKAKSWVSYVETKALSDRTIILNIKANDSYGERISEIYIKDKASSLQDTISIQQEQNDAIILSEKEYHLSGNAQKLEIKVTTNIELAIIIPDTEKNWVVCNSTKSLNNKTLIFDIKENDNCEERICEVLIKDVSTSLNDRFIIHQQPMYCEIHYTSLDGNVVTMKEDPFGPKILYNKYENGKGHIRFERMITTIREDAFRGQQNLSSIILPGGIVHINENAFRECRNLKSVILPKTIISIGKNAFYFCENITSITIHNNIKTIGPMAFKECPRLNEVIFESVLPPALEDDVFDKCIFIKVNEEYINSYKESMSWKKYQQNLVTLDYEHPNYEILGEYTMSGVSYYDGPTSWNMIIRAMPNEDSKVWFWNIFGYDDFAIDDTMFYGLIDIEDSSINIPLGQSTEAYTDGIGFVLQGFIDENNAYITEGDIVGKISKANNSIEFCNYGIQPTWDAMSLNLIYPGSKAVKKN